MCTIHCLQLVVPTTTLAFFDLTDVQLTVGSKLYSAFLLNALYLPSLDCTASAQWMESTRAVHSRMEGGRTRPTCATATSSATR